MEITKEYIKNKIEEELNSDYKKPGSVIHALLQKEFLSCDIEERRVDYRLTVSKPMINYLGTVHGAIVAGLLDESMAHACNAFFLTDTNVTTADMQFNCVKGLHEGDEIIIRVFVRHLGRRTVVAQSEIRRGNEICAFGTESFGIISKDVWQGRAPAPFGP